MSDDECGCEQQHLLYNQVGSRILFSMCKASQSWLWQANTREAMARCGQKQRELCDRLQEANRQQKCICSRDGMTSQRLDFGVCLILLVKPFLFRKNTYLYNIIYTKNIKLYIFLFIHLSQACWRVQKAGSKG